MGFPTVSVCCCGCSLRTGTIIIIIIDLISELTSAGGLGFYVFYAILSNKFLYYILKIISICLILCGAYGTFWQRPQFIVPYLMYYGMNIMGYIFFMVFIILIGPAELKRLADESPLPPEEKKKIDVEIFSTITVVMVEIVLAIFLGITYYMFTVIYSYYKELEAELGTE